MNFKKILFLGPKLNKVNPAISGGGAVLFEDLLAQTEDYDFKYKVIDTNGSNYLNNLTAYVSIILKFLFSYPQYKYISIHGTAKDYIWLAPVIIFFSKLLNKKISMRKFAGNFNDIYEKSNLITKFLIRYVLRTSDINFFETKYLVNNFKIYNKHTYWFPNTRPRPNLKKNKKEFTKRFIFVGHIRKEKGIIELLEASNQLDKSYVIDLYGSLFKNVENIDFDIYHVNYKGSLKPEEVILKMSKYDVLVLPSYREGYPGVIIEALSLGLPVIATNLKGVKEIVNEKSSVLIDPKNVKQLKEAIESFDEMNYSEKSDAALKQFEKFDSKLQYDLFFKRIEAENSENRREKL